MLKAEQIPDEVFEAFQKAWAVTSTLSTKECLAAAINAWPGMAVNDGCPVWHAYPHIIIPISEKQNAET